MIYVLLLQENKFYVGYSNRPIGERFVEHFNYKGSKWTTLYRPVQVLEVQEGGIEEENEMTLRMMDKYGWWNVRGGSWCQVNIKSCPQALLEWQSIKLPTPIRMSTKSNEKTSVICKCNISAVLRSVKKDGSNFGKQFFVCAKSQSDASKCNFFQWNDCNPSIRTNCKRYTCDSRPIRDYVMNSSKPCLVCGSKNHVNRVLSDGVTMICPADVMRIRQY